MLGGTYKRGRSAWLVPIVTRIRMLEAKFREEKIKRIPPKISAPFLHRAAHVTAQQPRHARCTVYFGGEKKQQCMMSQFFITVHLQELFVMCVPCSEVKK
jgi:hypothetical protein